MDSHPTNAEGLFSRMNREFWEEDDCSPPPTESEKNDNIPDDDDMNFFPDDSLPL